MSRALDDGHGISIVAIGDQIQREDLKVILEAIVQLTNVGCVVEITITEPEGVNPKDEIATEPVG